MQRYFKEEWNLDEARNTQWLRHWIGAGLDALEEDLARRPATPYCFGETPTYADCCLVPQMYTAERFGAVRHWPRLQAVTQRCREHDAFDRAQPDRQPDAQKV